MLRTSYIHPAPNNTCTPTPATQELHFAQASKRVAGALAIATALTGARCAALHPVHAASFVPGCSLCACACACCLCLCLCLYIMHTSVYVTPPPDAVVIPILGCAVVAVGARERIYYVMCYVNAHVRVHIRLCLLSNFPHVSHPTDGVCVSERHVSGMRIMNPRRTMPPAKRTFIHAASGLLPYGFATLACVLASQAACTAASRASRSVILRSITCANETNQGRRQSWD